MSSRSLAKKHEALNREIGYESRAADFDVSELNKPRRDCNARFLSDCYCD